MQVPLGLFVCKTISRWFKSEDVNRSISSTSSFWLRNRFVVTVTLRGAIITQSNIQEIVNGIFSQKGPSRWLIDWYFNASLTLDTRPELNGIKTFIWRLGCHINIFGILDWIELSFIYRANQKMIENFLSCEFNRETFNKHQKLVGECLRRCLSFISRKKSSNLKKWVVAHIARKPSFPLYLFPQCSLELI